jgi:WD40 repeat protein
MRIERPHYPAQAPRCHGYDRPGRVAEVTDPDGNELSDAVSTKRGQAPLADHGDDVKMSVFHPVDELIATASRDYFVRVYDFDARLVAKFGGSDGDVVWLDWTADGRQLVALSDDGQIKRWSWATKQLISASGGVVFSTCADRSVVWHSLTGWRELHRTDFAHKRFVNGCAALPDGRFTSVGRDLTLQIRNRTYDCVTICPPINRSIRCVAACPRGRIIAIGSYGGHIARYDAITHRLLSLDRPTTVGISALAFSVAHNAFLCSSYDGQVYSTPARNR